MSTDLVENLERNKRMQRIYFSYSHKKCKDKVLFLVMSAKISHYSIKLNGIYIKWHENELNSV